MASRSFRARTQQRLHLTRPLSSTQFVVSENTAQKQLEALRLEFAELYRELFEAAQMQRMMSGPRLLRRGEFELAAEIFPVRHLSGDFLSISDSGSTTLLAIGDIEGKGLRAGMWFTHFLGLTRMFAESTADPGEALAELNQHVCLEQSQPPLTSLFLARLDWTAGTMVYSSAGHPAPLLLRADGVIETLSAGGPLLSAVPGAAFESASLEFGRGDMFVAYTDGLLECANESFEEFGVQRVIEELRSTNPKNSVTEILFSIIGAAQDFAGTRPRADDCTAIVLRRDGAIAS